MDFTARKYSGQGSFTVKKGTIDKLQFLHKTIGIYPWQVSMILYDSKLSVYHYKIGDQARVGQEGCKRCLSP